MIFTFRGRNINCNETKLFGILNVTPDSFSDGGKYLSKISALKRALQMLEEGATVIDIGGESSRPGASEVYEKIEIARILPVITEIRKEKPDAVISIDTTKYEVAAASLDAGADIINDISGLRNSQQIAKLCAKYDAGLVLMHMRGTPATMRNFCSYTNLFEDIKNELSISLKIALDAGLKTTNIIIDPGVGFAKNTAQNLEIVRNWATFKDLGFPVLIGHSKKSFIGETTGTQSPDERLAPTCALTFFLALQKIHFLRVHDIKENLQAIKLAEAIGKI